MGINKFQKTVYFAAFILLAGVGPAYATGTPAGETVVNTATLHFKVGGIDQPGVVSSAKIVVDRKIIFTVTRKDPSYVSVVTPTTAPQALTFEVHNDSNDTLDFALHYVHDVGTGDPFGAVGSTTDTFDSIFEPDQFYQDTQINGVFNGIFDDPSATRGAGDTPVPVSGHVPFLDNVAPDKIVTVFVVSKMPPINAAGNPLQNGDISSGTLFAAAHHSGTAGSMGSVHFTTGGLNDPLVVDTVFADGPGAADLARDGIHSDDDAYRVGMTTLKVTKSATVISDGVGTSSPTAIPGAIIEYCIVIVNNGNKTVENVVITDKVPAGSTYASESIFVEEKVLGTPPKPCIEGSGTPENDARATDPTTATRGDPTGSYTPDSTTGVVTTTVFELAPGDTTSSRFRVTINPKGSAIRPL